jgi:hypothetical protein
MMSALNERKIARTRVVSDHRKMDSSMHLRDERCNEGMEETLDDSESDAPASAAPRVYETMYAGLSFRDSLRAIGESPSPPPLLNLFLTDAVLDVLSAEYLNLNVRHLQVLDESNNLLVMEHTLCDAMLFDQTRTNLPVNCSSVSHFIQPFYSREELNCVIFAVRYRMGIFKDTRRLWLPLPRINKSVQPFK